MKKFMFLCFSFFVFFSVINSSKAIAISNPAEILENFNTEMVDKVSDSFLQKPFLQFSNDESITRTIFMVCFLIALFGILKDFGGPSMMTQLFELGMYSVVVLALLGEPSSYGLFSSLGFQTNITPTGMLDRDIYKHLKGGFDGAAKEIFKKEDSNKLWDVSLESTVFTDRMIRAQSDCDYPKEQDAMQKKCFRDYIETGDHVKQKNITAGTVGRVVLAVGTGGMSEWIMWVTETAVRLLNPFVWFFPLLFWLVKLATSVVNVFLVLGYGLAAAISLFFAKLVLPLLLLPSQRGAVMKGLKTPLSITLWGFLMQLIIFMAVVFTEALNAGAKGAALKAIGDSSFDLVALGTILGAMVVTQLVVMLFPLVAMFKIPKLAEDLLNFSVSSVVSFGQDLLAATGGLAKMAAGLAMPAASMIGGAMGGAIGAASPMAGKALGSLGAAAKGLGSKVLGEGAMASLSSKASSFGSSAKDGLGKVQGFRDKFSDMASGNQNSGLSRATQQSVKKSYENFAKSDKAPSPFGSSPDKVIKGDSKGSVGGGSSGGGGGGGGGGPSKWDAIKKAGAAGISQVGDLAISSVAGGPSGAASAVQSSLGSGAAALGSGLVQGGQMLREGGDKLKNIQAHLLRDKKANTEQKRVAQDKVAQAAGPKTELNEQGLKSFQSVQRKMQQGEALTEKDSEILSSLQKNNLNEEQSQVVGDALSQRYDEAVMSAQESGDYSEVLKLSNNEYANEALRKKDEINKANLAPYRKIRQNIDSQVAKLQAQALESGSLVSTLEAQAQLADMSSQGVIGRSALETKLFDPSVGVNASVAERTRFQQLEQDREELNKLTYQTNNKTSMDFDKIKMMADRNKFALKDDKFKKDIEASLDSAGIKFDFEESKKKDLDLGTGAKVYSNIQQDNIKNENSIKVGKSEFKFDKDNKIIATSFTDNNGDVKSTTKLNSEDRESLQDQLNSYQGYLSKLDNLKLKHPEQASQFETEAQKIRSQRDLLLSIKDALNQKKK